MSSARSAAIAKTEEYYDSIEADEFYKNFWGGEDIHIGLYATPDEDISKASAFPIRYFDFINDETQPLFIP